MLCQGCLSGDAAAPEEGGEACPVPAALPVSSSGCFVCSALLSIKGGDGSGFPRAAGTEQMSPGRARDDAGVAQHTVSALERSGRTELGTGRVLSHPQGTQRMGLLQTHRPKNTGTAGERHGGITPTSGVSPQQGDHPNIPGVIPARGSPRHPGCHQHPGMSPLQGDHPNIQGVTNIPGCHHHPRCHHSKGITPASGVSPPSQGVITVTGSPQHPRVSLQQVDYPNNGITPTSQNAIPAGESPQYPGCHPCKGIIAASWVSSQHGNQPKGIIPGVIPPWD